MDCFVSVDEGRWSFGLGVILGSEDSCHREVLLSFVIVMRGAVAGGSTVMVAVEEVSENKNTSRTELKASDMRLAGKMKVFDTRS